MSATAPITFVDAEGRAHAVAAPIGLSVMEALKDAGLIDGECGGSLACATCHVWVDPAFADRFDPAGPGEEDMLDVAFNVRVGSRLSCQLPMTAEAGGLIVSAPRGKR